MSLRPFLVLLFLLPLVFSVGCDENKDATPVETGTPDGVEETGNASCELEGSEGEPGLTLAHGETWCGGSTVSEELDVSVWIQTCEDGGLVEETCAAYGASDCFNTGAGSAECMEPGVACYIQCIGEDGGALATTGTCGYHTGGPSVGYQKAYEDVDECAADAADYCEEYGGGDIDEETPAQTFYYFTENPDETNCEMDTVEMDESLWVEVETSSER